MRNLGRSWFAAVFAAAAILGLPGTATAQVTAPADAVFAAVDLLVRDSQRVVDTLRERADGDPEVISTTLQEIPRLESYAATVQRDLAAVGTEASADDHAAWVSLEDQVRALGVRLKRARTDVALPRPTAASVLAQDLEAQLALIRGAKRAVIDGWSARAVEPLTTMTVGLGGASAVVFLIGTLLGVLRDGPGHRRLLWSVALSMLLVAIGTGIAAVMHLQFVRTASLSVVSLLPVGAFGLIAIVVLTEVRRTPLAAQRAGADTKAAPLPEMRVDDSAGMMVWGEKLDALEQLRRLN